MLTQLKVEQPWTQEMCVFIMFLSLFNEFSNQVKKDDATYTETPVEISGNDDQIKKAKELIQEIIGPSSSVINNMGGMWLWFSLSY